MKRDLFYIITIFMLSINTILAQNYSKQMQQAILLYQEGKNTDAMDRFMDILVSGTPEEKIIASEYISKITQGVPPTTTQKTDIKLITTKDDNKKETKTRKKEKKTKEEQTLSSEISQDEILAKKVSDKIKEMKSEFLVSLYRKTFIKIYMDQNNENPNYILIKEDRIFNEDLTFKSNILEDLKMIAGLLTILGKATVTILPNGSITGNMKIANVRKATILHSYFQSFGLSPTKLKLDIIGSSWQSAISKRLDDFEGIIIAIDYSKEPDLSIEADTPQVSIALYPSIIDTSKNQTSIVEFSVLKGKNPIASWKLFLNKKTKPIDTNIQKIENTIPVNSMIVFNGREKFIGNEYEPGEYEFILEASDTKGNTSTARKTITIISQSKNIGVKKIEEKKQTDNIVSKKSKIQKTIDSKTAHKNKKDIFYKIYFEKDSFNITKLSQEALENFIEDIKGFPNSKILITGYAHSKEDKPKTVAYKRANTVKNQLIKKYKISSKRIEVTTKVVNFKKTIVEITLK